MQGLLGLRTSRRSKTTLVSFNLHRLVYKIIASEVGRQGMAIGAVNALYGTQQGGCFLKLMTMNGLLRFQDWIVREENHFHIDIGPRYNKLDKLPLFQGR